MDFNLNNQEAVKEITLSIEDLHTRLLLLRQAKEQQIEKPQCLLKLIDRDRSALLYTARIQSMVNITTDRRREEKLMRVHQLMEILKPEGRLHDVLFDEITGTLIYPFVPKKNEGYLLPHMIIARPTTDIPEGLQFREDGVAYGLDERTNNSYRQIYGLYPYIREPFSVYDIDDPIITQGKNGKTYTHEVGIFDTSLYDVAGRPIEESPLPITINAKGVIVF